MSRLTQEILISGDQFSQDRKYRYKLWRVWEARDSPKSALFIMLNPSIATKEIDDPTQVRCRTFAQREGCTQYYVGNLFALVSTDPKGLSESGNPTGPLNDKCLQELIDIADLIIVAWGSWNGSSKSDKAAKWLRVRQVMKLLEGKEVYCLGTNRDGNPKHPLYVRADRPLEKFLH